MGRYKFTPAKRDKFIKLYQEIGVKNKCAAACGVTDETIDQWRKKDEEFSRQYDEAYNLYRDRLEEEALRRAVEGVPEPVYFKGEVVGHILKYSDNLLTLMLKRHIPAYRDKATIDHNVSGGVLVVPGTPMDSAEWEKVHRKE
jgi:hypothetical protein